MSKNFIPGPLSAQGPWAYTAVCYASCRSAGETFQQRHVPHKNDITYCCTLLRGKCSRRGRVVGAEPEYNPTAIQMETRALVVHYTWSWSSNAHMLRLSSMSLRPQRICDECPSTASVWTSALHNLGLRGNRTHPLVPGIPERRDGSIKANAKCERSGEDRGHVYAWR